MKEYAMYKGDAFLYMGTILEIASYIGAKRESVAHWTTLTYKKRLSNRNSTNAIELVEIDPNWINEI